MIDVESEIAEAIKEIGGERVSDYLDKSPAFNNADYIFHNYKIVAELKCLDEDKMNDPKFINKASKIYKEELEAGNAPVVAFGTVNMSTQGFSQEYVKKIRSLYRKPIKERVNEANKQIKLTKNELGVGEYKGLVIVVNNNNSALDPWHMHNILEDLMLQRYYSGINGALFFNANQKTVSSQDGREYLAWVELDREEYPKIESDFRSIFRDCWFKHYTSLIGESDFTVSRGAVGDLAKLDNKNA